MRFKYKVMETEKKDIEREIEIPFSKIFWWYMCLCMASVGLIYAVIFFIAFIIGVMIGV
jgi:hypothetical protein